MLKEFREDLKKFRENLAKITIKQIIFLKLSLGEIFTGIVKKF